MFFIPPTVVRRVVRVVVVVGSLGAVVVLVRINPSAAGAMAHGFTEGAQVLLIEHVLHHWGEITVASLAALAHWSQGE